MILQGYQIEGFEIATDAEQKKDNGAGFIGGIYSSFKGNDERMDFNISKIARIRVIENSDFAIRNQEDAASEGQSEIVDFICAMRR